MNIARLASTSASKDRWRRANSDGEESIDSGEERKANSEERARGSSPLSGARRLRSLPEVLAPVQHSRRARRDQRDGARRRDRAHSCAGGRRGQGVRGSAEGGGGESHLLGGDMRASRSRSSWRPADRRLSRATDPGQQRARDADPIGSFGVTIVIVRDSTSLLSCDVMNHIGIVRAVLSE